SGGRAIEVVDEQVAITLGYDSLDFVYRARGDHTQAKGAGGVGQQIGQVKCGGVTDVKMAARLELLECADQPERGAAQAIGVALAGGRQPYAPDAQQGFNPLGHEDDGGGERACLDGGVQADAIDRKSTRLNSSHV